MTSFEFFEEVSSAGRENRDSQLTVQLTHERSSWVALPPALTSRLFLSRTALPLALELRPLQQHAGISVPSDTPCYVAWAGASCAAGYLGVPAGLARALGLAQGARVALRPLSGVPEAVSVTVEPASEDDWEVVELNAQYLEEQLLNQVGVACASQPLPFWIRNHAVVLKVTAALPAGVPVVRLARGSEIYVAPRLRVPSGAAAAAAAADGGGSLFGGTSSSSGGGGVTNGGDGKLAEQQQQQQRGAGKGAATAVATHDSGSQRGQQPPQQEGAEEAEEEDSAAAPLQAVLRVQQVNGTLAPSLLAAAASATATGTATATSAAAGLAANAGSGRQQELLPPTVRQVFACRTTLARCGLQAGDWVRLAGRNSRSLVKFASLAASELAAPGHLALTDEQCEWAGTPPCSHVRLQRLTRSQRKLILEAAELQRANGSRTTGSSRATAAGTLGRTGLPAAPAADGSSSGSGRDSQQRQPPEAAQRQQHQQQTGASVAAQALLADSGWLRPAAEAALQHLLPVLGMTPRSLLQSWGAPRPGGLLVAGPAGSGKSALLEAAAAALHQHPECLTYSVTVSCQDISAEGTSQAQAQIMPKVQEALEHMPALLVFDDLDVLCPAESAGADGAATSADPGLVAWLCDLLDYLSASSLDWGRLPMAGAGAATAAPLLGADARSSCGGSGNSSHSSSQPGSALGPALWPPLAVAATCRDASSLAAQLRVAGRLDHLVSLPAPTAESRAAILGSAAQARGGHLEAQHLRMVAERADGFDAADLGVLLDRAMHIAVRRQLAAGGSAAAGSSSGRGAGQQVPAVSSGALQLVASKPGANGSSSDGGGGASSIGGGRSDTALPAAAAAAGFQLRLTQADMLAALGGFTPAAFWGTGSRKAVQAGVQGWADVGGMEEAQQALHEALELPTKYARLVAKAPLRLRTGVLLYGPPGCGKTHIVAAAVAAANVRCITVSGPELLNKYIGASEAAVRDVFQRAAAAAPSVLFFDEFDAIAPQRGHDNTGVTDRVVNQLLTELDGVEGLRGVCVVGATSRPDLIDAALLRPGRLDRLVYCGFPSPLERGSVLRALSRGVQLDADVDLGQAGYNAEYYSGADLSALLAEAQLAAVHETLEASTAAALGPSSSGGDGGGSSSISGKVQAPATRHHVACPVVIQRRHLEAALGSARPSVPEGERERLESIYSKFRQDREPGGARSAVDNGKGKLVTWA